VDGTSGILSIRIRSASGEQGSREGLRRNHLELPRCFRVSVVSGGYSYPHRVHIHCATARLPLVVRSSFITALGPHGHRGLGGSRAEGSFADLTFTVVVRMEPSRQVAAGASQSHTCSHEGQKHIIIA
jgi:hypothetical protein